MTCSTSKVEACRELGVDLAIDYTTDDFVELVGEVTGGRGVDVILDVIGGDYINRNLRAVTTEGTIVQVGLMGGGATPVDLGLLLSKRVHDDRHRAPGASDRGEDRRHPALRRRGAPAVRRGQLTPVIDSRFPLEQIAAAHQRMASNANVGKILIEL